MSNRFYGMRQTVDAKMEDFIGWLMEKTDEGMKWWHPLTPVYYISLIYDSMFCRATYHFGGIDEYLEWVYYGMDGNDPVNLVYK